jgi:hypothetical protein
MWPWYNCYQPVEQNISYIFTLQLLNQSVCLRWIIFLNTGLENVGFQQGPHA